MPEFRKVQDSLGAKRKQLKKKGLGNNLNACRELRPSEEPSRSKLRHLEKVGDIKLAQDPETKNEIFMWVTNRGTKTEIGGERDGII